MQALYKMTMINVNKTVFNKDVLNNSFILMSHETIPVIIAHKITLM